MYRCLLVAAGRSYGIDRSCSIQSAHVLQAASLRRRSNLPTWSTVRHHCPQSSPRTDNLRLLQSPASGELANNGQAAGQLHHFSITRLQKKNSRSEIRTVQIRQIITNFFAPGTPYHGKAKEACSAARPVVAGEIVERRSSSTPRSPVVVTSEGTTAIN